jgi:hypothetical protein
VRFVFTPPADRAAGLLTLPWSVPLAQWRYALKELSERLARREYRVLRALADLAEQVLPAAPPPLDETLDDATGPIDVVVEPLGDAATTASGEWISRSAPGPLPD